MSAAAAAATTATATMHGEGDEAAPAVASLAVQRSDALLEASDNAAYHGGPAAKVHDPPTNHVDGHNNNDDDDDDCYAGIGQIPVQLTQSTESDTVRFQLGGQGDIVCSAEHMRAGLFSPTFEGGVVSYSRSNPPVPAALRALPRAWEEGTVVAPPLAAAVASGACDD